MSRLILAWEALFTMSETMEPSSSAAGPSAVFLPMMSSASAMRSSGLPVGMSMRIVLRAIGECEVGLLLFRRAFGSAGLWLF